MKRAIHYCISWFTLLYMGGQLNAQIAYQGFEQSASDTWSTTFSTPPCTNGTDVWDYSTNLNGLLPSVGASFWGVQDLTGNCGTAAGETITFATVSVAGYTGVTIQFDYDIFGFDNGDDVFYTVTIDGVAQPQVQLVNGNANLSTGGYVTETINIPNGSSTVGFELLVDQDGGADYAAFDNFILDGTNVSGCTHTVSGFTPTSAPVGAEIRIVGTGFTNGTAVDFGGVGASVEFVSPTVLVATVPAGAGTAPINIIENGCTVTTAAFGIIEGGATCGGPVGGLVITEVYDEASGSLGYIELYNGTGATLDLNDYRIDRYATLTGTTSSHSYTFPTTGIGSSIASGQVLVGRVSTTAGSGVHDFVFTGSTAGFNDGDRLELVFVPGPTVIDDFHDDVIGVTGYVYRRNTTISGSNPTYNPSEWNTAPAGDQSDLGTYNVTPSGTPPSITAQPSDNNTCVLDFSVTATAGSGGALTYQWFYNRNNGADIGWSPVTAGVFPRAVISGATGSNLIMSGDMTDYDNYQFYVQVREGASCLAISEAVEFDLTTGRYFRSTRVGDWTDPNLWETATSLAGPWSPTCTYPTAGNSDYVHILNTHEVTVDIDITIDELFIESVGEVIIPNNRALIINDGTGTDLIIDGILTDNGIGGTNGLRFASSTATWRYGFAGEVVKTGTSSVTQYRDHYEGGIALVPFSAIWRYRYIGPSSPTVSVATVGMIYPNLYFESTNGAHSFSNPSELFQGNSGFVIIKGSLFVGATGTGAVSVFNTNTNTVLMQIQRDLVIGGNGFPGDARFSNHFNGAVGTGVEVLGTLLINDDGILDYDDGTPGSPEGRFRLHGNWTNLSLVDGFEEGESIVEFVGSVLQLLNRAPSAGDENFYDVLVNKPNGFLQNNIGDMVIENNMNFIRGIVRTSPSTYLVFEPNATVVNASNVSHVEGPVVRETDNGIPNTFVYPTGNDNIYGPIGIETRFHLGQDFVARYWNVGYGDYDVNAAELDHVSRIEYWNLDKIGGNLAENLRVTLHWGPHSRVITPSSIRVAHYYTEAPSTSDQWEREGNAPVITGNATLGSVESDWVTSFSPFTLGDVISQRSLPLDLLQFDVTKVGRQAEIEWQVANEQAGDHYCLQRSADGISYEDLVCYEATQDKNLASYQYTDEQPMNGYNYYRIHQIDYAGEEDYSPTKVLDFGAAAPDVQLFPNPTRGLLQVNLPVMEGDYQVQVMDDLGRVVYQTNKSGLNATQHLDLSGLIAGTYVVRVISPSGGIKLKQITIIR